MKALHELPESKRKVLFWISFVVLTGIASAVWAVLFFSKDIKNFKNFELPAISSEEIKESMSSLKGIGETFKENTQLFEEMVGQLKTLENLGGDLSVKEQQQLDEWAQEKEARGEEVTFEATLEFLKELRASGATTMPSEN